MGPLQEPSGSGSNSAGGKASGLTHRLSSQVEGSNPRTTRTLSSLSASIVSKSLRSARSTLHTRHFSEDHGYSKNLVRLEFDAAGPPFCGRRSELGDLINVYRKVTRLQRPASVIVQGGPGSGKSRLIRAFREQIMTWNKSDIVSGSEQISNNDDQNRSPSAVAGIAKIQSFDSEQSDQGETSIANDAKSNQSKQEQEKHQQLLPPIFCAAKFEPGQAASSESLGPILECFSTITEALLSTKESRNFWKPILSQALEKHLLVLVPLMPSLRELEPPPAAPPIPRPQRLSDRAKTAPPGERTQVSKTDIKNIINNHGYGKGEPLITRAHTVGTTLSNRRYAPVSITRSQPPVSSNPSRMGISSAEYKRFTKSHPPKLFARLATVQQQHHKDHTSGPMGTSFSNQQRSQTVGQPTGHTNGSLPKPVLAPRAHSEPEKPSASSFAQSHNVDSVTWQPLEKSFSAASFASAEDREPMPTKTTSTASTASLEKREHRDSGQLLQTSFSNPKRSKTFGQPLRGNGSLPEPVLGPRAGSEPDMLASSSSIHSLIENGTPVPGVTSLTSATKPTERLEQQLGPNELVTAWKYRLDEHPNGVSDSSAVATLTSPPIPACSILKEFASANPMFDSKSVEPSHTFRAISEESSESKRMTMSEGRIPSSYFLQQGTSIQDMSMRSAVLRTKSRTKELVVHSQRAVNRRWKANKRQSHFSDDDSHTDSGAQTPHRKSGVLSSGSTNSKIDHEDYSVERIQFALRAYLRCVCKWRTVVFLLDDIHWAGREAVAVFRTFLMDTIPSPRKFLFVVAHRPLPQGHDMAKLICDLEEAAFRLNGTQGFVPTAVNKPEQVEVDSLKHEDVVELLSKLLKRDKDDVEPLAVLVHRKTAGNCFFVIEFVRLLEKRFLIYFSIAKTRWEWADLDEIGGRTEISDNVVDVVASTICEASPEIKLALLMAAAFGAPAFSAQALFKSIPSDESMKRTLIQRASTEVQLQLSVPNILSVEALVVYLDKACEHRYLESLGSLRFKFAHDRIREATLSLLPNKVEMDQLRLQIGRQLHFWLMEQLANGICDEKLLLQVVIQLNQASYLMESTEEKVDLIELNYAAAQNAIQRSSFFPASDFLRTGIELLGENPWSTNYDQMIKLSDALMRMDYCCGRLVVSVEIANEILRHALCFDDKKMAYHIKVLWLTQNERTDEALDLILSVLKDLGAPVPRRFLRVHTIRDRFRTARMMRGLPDEELLSLPPATAEHIDDIGSFMERLEEVSLNRSNPRPDLLSVALLRVMQLTLKHGRFSMTPTCLVSLGWYHARAGRLDAAHRFGELGVKLAREQSSGYHDARAILMYYMHIYHWRIPYNDGIKPTTEALQQLWDSGAIEYVFLDTITYLRIYFCCGLRLQPLAADIRKYVDLLKDYGHRLAFENHVAFFQCVESLIGEHDKETYCSFTGDFVEQGELMAHWKDRRFDAPLQHAFFQRMMQAYFFADMDLALEMYNNLSSPFDEGPDVLLPFRVFFIGMTALSLYKLKKKTVYRRKGKKMIKILERWKRNGVVNVRHMLLLLHAEFNSVTHIVFRDVRRSFDDAISMAARCGFLHFQALGNERAGVYCREKGEHDWGQVYILRSRELYSDWGAMAKVRIMAEQHSEYLEGSAMPTYRHGSTIYSKARLGDISKEFYKDLRTDAEN
ncbi:hypothetical protein ACA910_006972 [Epithemia clementina (nom. ined.)]